MISIIIPANALTKKVNPRFFYKKRFSLDDTIQSIVQTIDVEYELILVINDYSNKELIDYVANNGLIHKYCINSSNVGVARSWNIGAHLAEGRFLCFCNDDVEFSKPAAFSTLLSVFETYDNVGEVGPQGGRWHLDQSGERTGVDGIGDADEISGYFFIMPASIFHQAGGFDNFYTPAGCEEIDMSFKIRSLGYKCLVVPGTGIIHHGGHGISNKKTIVRYFDKEIDTVDLDKRNKKYFVGKWYS